MTLEQETCISRETVIEHICKSRDCYKENCKGIEFKRCPDILWVLNLPPVTPTYKKGKWVAHHNKSDDSHNIDCSYCGAKMQEVEPIEIISLDKVKQAREEIWKNVYEYSGSGNEVTQAYCDGFKSSLAILDKLISESEE